MSNKILIHRILGILYTEAVEDQEHVKKQMKRAAGGAYPYVIREMMKQHGWAIVRGDADETEKEKGKLLICYSWWARALEHGIPQKYFEEYMLDHLEYLDSPASKGSGDELSLDKWKKYG
jgi:hypothetical protein